MGRDPPALTARITLDRGEFADTAIIRHEGWTETYLTLRALPGEDGPALARRLAGACATAGGAVADAALFGRRQDVDAAAAALDCEVGPRTWPLMALDGHPLDGSAMAGAQAHLIDGLALTPILQGGRPVGSLYADDRARYVSLADVGPASGSAPAGDQVTSALAGIEEALSGSGMSFGNVTRTWLFVDRLLECYDDLNQARNRFFAERRVFDGLVPASTGIAGANPRGETLVMAATAVDALDSRVTPFRVGSPLQCSAHDYGSSFSRAMELTDGVVTRLQVSGTASIAPSGVTAHVGRSVEQVDLTMHVVEAILISRGMSFADTTRALIYVKRPEDAQLPEQWLRAQGVAPLPAVTMEADVCRDDLLFEIELDAWASVDC